MDDAFDYAEGHKMDLEADYKYKAKTQKCTSKAHKGVFKVKSYHDVTPKSVS